MKIYIKNMVCPAFKPLVKSEIENLGFTLKSISLGEAVIEEVLSERQWNSLDAAVKTYALGLSKSPDYLYVKRIMVAVNHLLNHSWNEFKKELPVYINKDVDFHFLDDVFTREEGLSIEKYFTSKKIEKAKELLTHYHLGITEVAYQLGFADEDSLMRCIELVPGTAKQIA